MKLGTPYNINNEEQFDYEKTVAFCAIGQPKQFFNLLTSINVVGTKIFDDHHCYCEKDIENLCNLAKELGATNLITTEKDAVKIKCLKNIQNIKIYATKLVPDININEVLS